MGVDNAGFRFVRVSSEQSNAKIFAAPIVHSLMHLHALVLLFNPGHPVFKLAFLIVVFLVFISPMGRVAHSFRPNDFLNKLLELFLSKVEGRLHHLIPEN